MNILFAGKAGFDYNRTKVLYEGLIKMQNINVQIFKLKSKTKFDKQKFAEITKNIDFIYVPPFRFRDAGFFKKHTKIPIIFDPLVSVFLTRVVDYKQYWKAPQKFIADFFNFRKCDILIADTQHHKDYFSSMFKISKKDIFVLPIGVDTQKFIPNVVKKKDNKFHVGFYGSFIPLQGIFKIIETAKLLQRNVDIVFEIIGDGHFYKKAKQLSQKYNLKNINFLGRISYEKLPEYINNFDIALGIFGDSLKADIVIPNKIYHYAAQKKCIITKETKGIKELFKNNKNIVLCSNEPKDIAEKILFLKNNNDFAERIANNAYDLVSTNYNEIKIAETFLQICYNFKTL